MPPNVVHASEASVPISNQENSALLMTKDSSAQISSPVSEIHTPVSEIQTGSSKSRKLDISDTAADSGFDADKFRVLQSETQQLSEQLTDFELVWTPRSTGDADLLQFPDDYSENESEWA
jgi:hypothetical protein